jgi:hypothetical protein
MLSLQTDQLRELAARSEDRELKYALHGAAETIENLILKHEAADKVTGHYPDGTLCVEVNDLNNVKRVIVESKKERLCKQFYGDELSCKGCKHRGQFENEYEYGYPCPYIRCKRRAIDNYECFVHISEITEEEAVKIWKRIKKEDK